MTVPDLAERVRTLEHELFRMTPENPGLSLRLDRVERLLAVMLKVGGLLAAVGVAWKALEIIGEIIRGPLTP